eukprot:TRINITY_DN55481_c0_g1_i1.p1 TRINITY_DN55481_c0_g1~~TRINITY_DN55481_c0_g1_i1.p1  ORF type:complete len:349 (-),score=23.16 TRINITY_DN55481_c0_g1_i1:378-1361(-)
MVQITPTPSACACLPELGRPSTASSKMSRRRLILWSMLGMLLLRFSFWRRGLGPSDGLLYVPSMTDVLAGLGTFASSGLNVLSLTPLQMSGSLAGSTRATTHGVRRAASLLSDEVTGQADSVCSCCELDWCGCWGCHDCYEYLQARGHGVPLDAASAYSAFGAMSWFLALSWRSAKMPRWSPVNNIDMVAGESSISGAGSGLFAAAELSAGDVLPPYMGTLLTFAEAKRGGSYIWCPMDNGDALIDMTWEEATAGPRSSRMSFCVDAEPLVHGNPARLVNGVATKEQRRLANVEICEIGQVMYYRLTKDVPAGTELLTDYGTYYTDF